MTTEQLPFQAEVNRVLNLVVHSLYTHKEIFLRELISNASDALDKISFRALTEHDLLAGGEELGIRLVPDPGARTLTVTDNGVGMTRQDMIDHLGTIAASGTQRFLEALEESPENLQLIGQFGVGFYSAFLVSDRVEVVSRAAGSEQAVRWSSSAEETFTIEDAERAARGTDVILHLKEDHSEYANDWRIKELVRNYSDFVSYPIQLHATKPKPVKEDGSVDESAPEVREFETINKAAALWRRPKSEIEEQEYLEFYKHLSHDWEEPLAHTHFQVEGMQSFTGLLYVPGRAPFDLYTRESHGVRLFVRRVFVTDDCKELLPEYLRFVRGLVDSDDLPLNISRETLQFDRVAASIRKQVTKKALDLLEELAGETEGERYLKFWETFGPVLKEGLHTDPESKDRIAELLRYPSSGVEGLTSLAGYVERMAEGQDKIYYVTADSLESARRSPHIEALLRRGFEVLFLTDPVDEWVVGSLTTYAEKDLISASQADIQLEPKDDEEDEEKKKEKEARSQELQPLLSKMKDMLGERVKEVRLSTRLTGSPCCLVAEGGMSARMERMLQLHDKNFQGTPRILELNADHALIQNMGNLVESSTSEGRMKDWTLLLYDQALLAEGSPISDPAEFSRRMTELMTEVSGS